MEKCARTLIACIALLGLAFASSFATADDYTEKRGQLVQILEREFAAWAPAGETGLSPQVREAMLATLRHEFVPQDTKRHAYANRPLPIGYGQTISQPFIVALMTQLLRPTPEHKILEIGTGSGYQAAVLAHLVKQVQSIEIIEDLADQAANRLTRLGYGNVAVIHGDGYYGLPEQAPFDAIIVTAAAGHIPPPLIEQLAPGGRMVIPVGPPFMTQELMLVHKDESGAISTRSVLPVAFVPLTGGH